MRAPTMKKTTLIIVNTNRKSEPQKPVLAIWKLTRF